MSEDEVDDPFACFDDSSDDDDDDESDVGILPGGHDLTEQTDGGPQRNHEPRQNTTAEKRDPENGVLAFHAGTEAALLHHVQTELAKTRNRKSPKRDTNDGNRSDDASINLAEIIQNAQAVLDLVDSYCISRHWMMHVGPEKATPLRKFIGDFLIVQEKANDTTAADGETANFVELGTYCGYSSIFIAKTVLERSLNNGKTTHTNTSGVKSVAADDCFSFHIYSVEVVEKFATVAQKLIKLAGMEAYISIVLMKDPDTIEAARRRGHEVKGSSLSSELKKKIVDSNNDQGTRGINEITTIDFLFVDHDKSLYLPHLRELEDAGMIRKGTHVAADNVVFAEIHDYRQYMTDLAERGIVSTRLEDSLFVEYCQPELATNENNDENKASTSSTTVTKEMLRDGIEFSVYL